MKQKQYYRGAPPGGRVHWLSDELTGEFGRTYQREYNYRLHNYRFTRYNKRTLIDEFLIVRTSKRCYRVIYYNAQFKFFQYFSASNYKKCADQMREIYRIFKMLENTEGKDNKKTLK